MDDFVAVQNKLLEWLEEEELQKQRNEEGCFDLAFVMENIEIIIMSNRIPLVDVFLMGLCSRILPADIFHMIMSLIHAHRCDLKKAVLHFTQAVKIRKAQQIKFKISRFRRTLLHESTHYLVKCLKRFDIHIPCVPECYGLFCDCFESDAKTLLLCFSRPESTIRRLGSDVIGVILKHLARAYNKDV